MKIAIIGSQTFTQVSLVEEYIKNNFNANDILVSGGAEGPDSIAYETVRSLDFPEPIIFKPEYKKYGRNATFARNRQIAQEADRVVAFWNGKSGGTKYTIEYARKLGKPVEIIYDKNKEKDLLDYI